LAIPSSSNKIGKRIDNDVAGVGVHAFTTESPISTDDHNRLTHGRLVANSVQLLPRLNNQTTSLPPSRADNTGGFRRPECYQALAYPQPAMPPGEKQVY
jgi:hypothetical protein